MVYFGVFSLLLEITGRKVNDELSKIWKLPHPNKALPSPHETTKNKREDRRCPGRSGEHTPNRSKETYSYRMLVSTLSYRYLQ
jgi:hypothetical protein